MGLEQGGGHGQRIVEVRQGGAGKPGAGIQHGLGGGFDGGNLLLLNPSVGFAVNDRVTLTTGVQWTHRQADRFDGQDRGMNRTATDLLLGVGYGFAKSNTLNTTLKLNASGRGGSELRAGWLYTF